ncbi:TPR-containing protein [Acrasis kona]|uniref:TPR-containing protein n=1 Tax=Acrasis kona TaxID=1008807 RepID=A0AAW2YY22_9EUKA
MSCPVTGKVGEQCPVIHAVNDDEFDDLKPPAGEEIGTEPENQNESDEDGDEKERGPSILDVFDFDEEFKDEIPSVAEYKKLRRITKMITGFYRNGTKTKHEQYEQSFGDLSRVESDILQSKRQQEVLESQAQRFNGHLKYKEYLKELEDEQANMKEQRDAINKTCEHYKGLWLWSTEIVKICEWLELNLDDYCMKNLDLPAYIKNRKIPEVPALTQELIKYYSKGLDEIMHNLNESRDFFQASVDGRLDKYKLIEKQIIEVQLKALEEFPTENNPRKEYIESELNEDLKEIDDQLSKAELDETKNRRQKMLKMHIDFIQVLRFFREKLHLLDEDVDKVYDPQFTTKFGFE